MLLSLAAIQKGKAFRMLTVIDEFTHESLAIKTKRQLNSTDVLECLNDLFTERGVPERRSPYIESCPIHRTVQ